jgi:ribonuclease BN (tRNA processing enzyme)
MELTVIGCSGSLPSRDSAASCYLAEAEGFRLVLDLGNGALGRLQACAPLDQIDAICISHLHGDHCLDMSGYQVARAYYPGGPLPPIPVYGPAGTAERLDRVVGSDNGTAMSGSFDFVTLAPGKLGIGPFTVTADHMEHSVETFGFRLEHAGRAIAYSADTGPAESLIRLADGADVLLCEATFAEQPPPPGYPHLTARQAGEHAARAGAGSLVLTHLMPWNDRDAALAEAAASYGGPVQLARPGLQL